MANTTLTTVIDNGSPVLTYTPFADTLSVPDLFGGWNPYYDLTGFASTPGEEGNGTSRHITARDGAQFAILNFFGTGLQLFGNITQFGTYDLQLDGQLNRSISTFSPSDSTILASYSDLSAANHSLILTFHNPSGDNSTFISIEHAAILDGPAEGGITSTVTDDEALSFVGQWSFLQDNTLGPSDSTFHTSSNAGDHFSFLFNGSAVTLTGFHDATSGQYSVQVDSNTTVFNGASSFKEATTLFFVSGLGSGTHNMTVINQEDRLLAVGAITVNSLAESGPTPISALSGSSLSGGSIAAIVVAIVLGILVALLLGFLIWRRRRLNALRRRMFMTDNVLDSDVMDIAPDDEIEERKPPSKTSPIQREGSGNSRSFTLSLPMQTRPSHSQRGDSGNSVQELPRSPSVSLVGSQAAAAGDGSTPPRSRFLEPSQNSPFAIEFAERATRERPRVLPSASRDKGTPFPVQVVQAAPSDPALPPTPITPITATDNGEDSPIRGRRSGEAGDDAIRAIHYSFLDISSREGSSRDGRTGSVYTSSSSSERARRNRLSEQTSGSHTRPISLGYAFQYHRNSDLGLFRRAQLQQQAHDPPAPPPAVPVPPLPTDIASSELTFSPIQSSSGPLSPIRPLPRVPQSPVSIAPTIGHSRVAEDRSIPRTPPALQLQTQWAPPPPPPAHLSPERERGAFSAATSTGLTFAFGSQRESLLLQPGAIGRRRFSIPHGSPTESVPLSVSDIHFRHSSDEDPEPGSVALERLSPGDVANTPRAYASPFIMQRLRGEQATLGSPVAPRYGSPISSPSGVSSTPRRPGHTAASSDPLPGPPFAPGLEQGP